MDPALRARDVDRWVEALVRPIARRYSRAIEDAGHAELMAEYFEPVSVRSLGDFLGLTAVSSDTLRDWFHRLSASLANAGMNADGSFSNPDGFADGDKAKEEIRTLVDPLLDRWTKHPDNHSAISHWLHDGMPAGTPRSREDIYPTLFVFLLGAMQEPAHAMGSTLAGLFTRPEQLEAVIDNPQLIARAIAGGLRWVAPIWSAAGRITVRATTAGSVDLPSGTAVMLSFGSANRDGGRYEAPSAYDITPPPLPHLGFRAGSPACQRTQLATRLCGSGPEG